MLIAREDEQQILRRLVAGARVGQSGVLVLRGEAGIGKTALLDHAVGLAEGMQVLRVAGTRPERDVAFAGLLQLLRPALGLIGSLPGPQAEALSVALALREGTGTDRFAVGAGTLGLLSRYAEERPVLVVIDDLHTLDRPSAEAVTFAARRLMTDPVVVLMGSRPDSSSPASGLPTLTLTGLAVTGARTLLQRETGTTYSGELLRRVHAATGGNPLVLVELAREPRRLDELPPHTPLSLPEVLDGVFVRRVDGMDGPSRRVLLLAAVSDGDLRVVERAARVLGLDPGLLTIAEGEGLLAVEAGRIAFRHPLVASGVYTAADPAERRRAHLAVAQALPEHDADRRAWHRSEAAVGVDAGLADDLAAVAGRARNRGAHDVAATGFERSALLTPDDDTRWARLLSAGECAWLAGQAERAEKILARAEVLTTSPDLRGSVAGLRGNIGHQAGSLEEARTLLRGAGESLAEVDPDHAVQVYADLVLACFHLADPGTGLAAAARIEELLTRTRTPAAQVLGRLAVGMARVLAGRGGIDEIRSAVAALDAVPEAVHDLLRPAWPVLGVLFLRESDSGRELVARVVGEVRSRCAIGRLPSLLFHTARDEATTDRWPAALAGYQEGVALAREAGMTTDLAMCLAGLAWLQARTGQEEECRAAAEEALGLAARHHIHLARAWSMFALGELELVGGHPGPAAGHFHDLDDLLSALGFLDVDLAPGPELVEALLRQGRRAEAVTVARDYHERARTKGQPWALSRAERTLGSTAERGEASGHFERALALHRASPDGFETARTSLAYGAALRRSGRRVAARTHLREALVGFERLGAVPWADQAAAELDATGATVARRGDSRLAALTPQELQIATLLGAGRTTREAAAALFLSPKTVEYHLRHVYTKLDLHSRSELAELLAEADPR